MVIIDLDINDQSCEKNLKWVCERHKINPPLVRGEPSPFTNSKDQVQPVYFLGHKMWKILTTWISRWTFSYSYPQLFCWQMECTPCKSYFSHVDEKRLFPVYCQSKDASCPLWKSKSKKRPTQQQSWWGCEWDKCSFRCTFVLGGCLFCH